MPGINLGTKVRNSRVPLISVDFAKLFLQTSEDLHLIWGSCLMKQPSKQYDIGVFTESYLTDLVLHPSIIIPGSVPFEGLERYYHSGILVRGSSLGSLLQ